MQAFVIGLGLVVAGLVGVFWGYRIFRILLPIYGGVAGFVIAYNWLGQGSWLLALIVGVVLAIILALIAFFLWSVLLAVSGALLGVALAGVIASSLNLATWLAVLLAAVLAVILSWLFWKFRNEMIIIGTVLVGAAAAAEGVGTWFGLRTGIGARLVPNPFWLLLLVAVVWVTLVVVGVLYQWPRYRHLGLWGFGRKMEPGAESRGAPVTEPASAAAEGAVATRGVPVAAVAATAAAVEVATAAPEEGEGAGVPEAAAAGEGVAAPVAAVAATAVAVEVAAAAPEEGEGAGVPETAAAGEGLAAPVAAVAATAAAVEVATSAPEEVEGVGAPEAVAVAAEAATKSGAVVDVSAEEGMAQLESTLPLENMAIFKQKLEFVEGIGPAYAEKLRAIGVMTVLDLLRQGATRKGRAALVERSGITGKLILKWVNHADLYRLKGVGSEYADLLEAAGVDTVVELANRNPVNLLQKMLETNEAKQLVRRPPVQSQVSDWVEQAKGLPRVIQY